MSERRRGGRASGLMEMFVEFTGSMVVFLVGLGVVTGIAALFRWSVPDLPELLYWAVGVAVLVMMLIPTAWLIRKIKIG
ncbi:hypothetical protein [Microbispora siamensis]|uniref:Uncharacterized protein n=1 Tax=Microbispora siamensis TaxID=564413 RepID=A0ABQ4GH33_9ACTN|nr:hypothetical protein [Microbispora siamensis]GIH60747.1 hypothetical protein Msi02_15640 [Microbispora siamensis]